MEDDERRGRLKSARTEVNIAAVADLVKNDSRIATRMTAESLTLRRLMSYIYIYIYGAPILDVSRSHTTTQHSR